MTVAVIRPGALPVVKLGENNAAGAASAADAQASAEAAFRSALSAGGFETPEYASQAAGEAATTAGQIFRVPLGTTPQTFNWRRRLASGSELVSPLATSAALSAPAGASLIGKAGGGTVQEAITALEAADGANASALAEIDASLLDLTNVMPVTGAMALAITDLNKLVIASGATSYAINLPPATVAGSALQIEIARSHTGVVTVQAASGSGKLVNGGVLVDMMAGESALAFYDGTNWRFMNWTRVPIMAEMVNASGAQSLTTGTFNDVPLAVAGEQLMQANLSALWNATGGYFTAPRGGTYAIDLHLWVEHSTGPGQYDVGVYSGASGGSAPPAKNFARLSVGTEVYRTLNFRAIFGVAKGNKLFPCIRPNSPLSSAAIVGGATLSSRITVTELHRA